MNGADFGAGGRGDAVDQYGVRGAEAAEVAGSVHDLRGDDVAAAVGQGAGRGVGVAGAAAADLGGRDELAVVVDAQDIAAAQGGAEGQAVDGDGVVGAAAVGQVALQQALVVGNGGDADGGGWPCSVNRQVKGVAGDAQVADRVGHVGRVGVAVSGLHGFIRKVPVGVAGVNAFRRRDHGFGGTIVATFEHDKFACGQLLLQGANEQGCGVVGAAGAAECTGQQADTIGDGLNLRDVGGAAGVNLQIGKVVAGSVGTRSNVDGVGIDAGVNPGGAGRHGETDGTGCGIVGGCAGCHADIVVVIQGERDVGRLQRTQYTRGRDDGCLYGDRCLRLDVVDHIVNSDKIRLDRDSGSSEIPFARFSSCQSSKGVAIDVLEAVGIEGYVIVGSGDQGVVGGEIDVVALNNDLIAGDIDGFNQRAIFFIEADASTALFNGF